MANNKHKSRFLLLGLMCGLIAFTVLTVDARAALVPGEGALQSNTEGVAEGEDAPPAEANYPTKKCGDLTIHADAVCPYKEADAASAADVCGQAGKDQVVTSIDFGCKGEGNGIIDLALAILRLLVNAVGIVLIGVTMWAGIQYGVSRGDPGLVTAAKKRLFNVFISLLLFLFSYVIINFLVPGFFL